MRHVKERIWLHRGFIRKDDWAAPGNCSLHMQSALGYITMLAAIFISATRLLQGSSWKRKMRIITALPDPVAVTIHQSIGRNVTRLTRYQTRSGQLMHTMELIIYRLEEVTLTELIYSIDPDAWVDVIPLRKSCGWHGSVWRSKRHSHAKLPDVTKYGNELHDD